MIMIPEERFMHTTKPGKSLFFNGKGFHQAPTPQRVIERGARAQRGKARAHESKTRARIPNYTEIFGEVYRLWRKSVGF